MRSYLKSFSTLSFLTMLFACLVMYSCTSPATNPDSQKEITKDSAGFVSLFDGTTLKGWDGDTAVWHVEDNSVVGQITASSTPRQRTTLEVASSGFTIEDW